MDRDSWHGGWCIFGTRLEQIQRVGESLTGDAQTLTPVSTPQPLNREGGGCPCDQLTDEEIT